MATNLVQQFHTRTVILSQSIFTNYSAKLLSTCPAPPSPSPSSSSSSWASKKTSVPKEFDSIPGPKALPLIGNLWRYFPLIGEYSLYHMDGNGRLNLAKYGKIVREFITPAHQVLHLFDPIHIEEMFKQEDRYPYRRSHRALLKFRRERPHLYKSGGIFPENGPEWARLRDIFKRHFLLAQNINPYDRILNQVADDTINLFRTVRNEKTSLVTELQKEMYKWSLESICAILLDCRMGCLASDLSPDSDAARLINAGNNTIEMVAKTELYAGWEKRPNRAYRSLERSQDDMSEIVYKHFCNKIRQLEGQRIDVHCDKRPSLGDGETLLTQFIRDSDIDRKDLFGMLVDGVMAGIDTTSITASFVCYFLSENQHYQNTLRDEIRDAQERFGVDCLKAEHFTSMPWLKAIIKETLRLRPLSIGVGRLTSEECIIGGYRIPANTMIITQNQVSCQLEEYFPEPNTFKPERWFDRQGVTEDTRKPDTVRRRRQSSSNAGKRFLWLPFGHGRRMCLGRRIAELELYILISKLVTEFRIEPTHTEPDPAKRIVGNKTMLINIPDRPINVRLVDIKQR